MSCVVEVRGAGHDVLHAVVSEGLPALRAALSAEERGLSRHVARELKGFLGCGDPERGGYVAVGARARRPVRRVQRLGGREVKLPLRTAACAGYTLGAGVSVRASDRVGLERLCRYILRPPLAKGRLERREDGTVVVGLKRAWSDGTTALELTPSELVEKLAALVPPPHANQVIYRGVLAGNASLRGEVVPPPPAESASARQQRRSERLTRRPRVRLLGERASWAELLRRVFGVDAYRCPRCGGRLALRTLVVNPPATTKILRGLERAQGPP